MRLITIFILCFFSIVYSYAQELGGIPNNVKFSQKTTKQTTVIYPNKLDSTANTIIQIFSQLDSLTKKSIGDVTKKWNVVLQNQTIIPNAYVRMAPKRSEFYLTPDFDNITSGTLPWATLLATHEYRHIQQFSNFNNGLTKFFTWLLGEQGQLLANGIAIPDYFFEGDAVYQETITTQQGRGQLPAFYSNMQALWNDNRKPNWMQMRNGSLVKQYPNHYELGYQLVAYGYHKYGIDFWKKVTNDATRFKGLFYPFAKAIKTHSGVNYKQFRQDAINFYKKPIDVSQENWFTQPNKTITNFYFVQATPSQNKVIALKESNKNIATFVAIENGKEKKIRVKDIAIDNYFSANNTQIIYSSYQRDARWAFKNYSNIKLIEIATGKQKTISTNAKLFQPSLNANGTQIVAVQAALNGTTTVTLLNVSNTNEQVQLTNANNYIYTYPKFLSNNTIVAIVRNGQGQNAFVNINTENNTETLLTPFTYKAMGYSSIHNDTIYFTLSHQNNNVIAALDVKTKQSYIVAQSNNAMFYPMVQNNTLYYSKVTSSGQLIATQNIQTEKWQLLTNKDFDKNAIDVLQLQNVTALQLKLIKQTNDSILPKVYNKAAHLLKPHSYTPSVSSSEYKLSILSNNILNSLSSTIDYIYNTNENSSSINATALYGGLYPFINAGTGATFNRKVIDAGRLVNFNTGKIYAGIFLPLQKVVGPYFRSINIGSNLVSEQLYYTGISKNVFTNKSLLYSSNYVIWSNQIKTATQHIYPRWAQAISISYRDGLRLINSKKLVVNSNFYFPGFAKTHNAILHFSYQKRDTTRDYFSNNFAFARGYEALNTRRMIKLGFDYHLPILYPDFGFGNIVFLQRIRAAFFADYNNSKARVSGVLQNIIYKSIGTEIYFDGKIWNALPINIGIRYSRLLNKDLLLPLAQNKWEIVLPISIVPN